LAKFLDLDSTIDKALGLDEFGIGQLRSIEFGKKYLWDIRFNTDDLPERINHNLPKKFQGFFPASDVEENRANLENFSFEVFMNSYQVPRKSQAKEITITFFDDIKNGLLQWFDDWINVHILNNGQFLSPLEDCVRLVDIRKLNNRREIQTRNSYWVIPQGPVTYAGTSSSEAQSYSLSFVVVGEVDQEGQGNNTRDQLIKSFGRQAISGGVGTVFRGVSSNI